MILSPHDGKLFYKLFLPLLVYANERFQIPEPIDIPEEQCLNQDAMVQTAEQL